MQNKIQAGYSLDEGGQGLIASKRIGAAGDRMTSKVAIVELDGNVQESFNHALKLIGKIDDLNTKDRTVVVKVGVFDPKAPNHPTVDVVGAVINSFDRAPRVYVAESDNYRGTGLERLQIWKELFTERVVPFNLSDDSNIREIDIASEKMSLSHIVFKPNVFVSTHALRKYEKGTILKNLFGLVPDKKKAKFHKKLEPVLLDIAEAIGGIDLAVIDATQAFAGPSARKGVDMKTLVVGRDAVAVEAVGAVLTELNPKKMPIIQGAVKRGLGEGDIDEIEILGTPIDSVMERIKF